MATAGFLYLVSFAFSIIVAYLFFRYIFWGFKSRLIFWKTAGKPSIGQIEELSRATGIQPPCFSIIIPARDEADVIGQTIDHMAAINYPTDRFELLVITDGKELRTKQQVPDKVTTQDVVEAKIRELSERSDVPAVKHVVVPYDFDGRVGGGCYGQEVASTKARALNYGIHYISTETAICSFFDAESRPAHDILLHLATRFITAGGRQKLWQGPVFQVRNFYQLGPINKIIALYQALAHEWYLPVLMQYLPFLGGTNLHVERNLLINIGGFDPTILSEDLELGVRSYLERGEWPEYLPVVSTEQTPATYTAYYRQRLRWGSGHLQVFDKLRKAHYYPNYVRQPLLKSLFYRGHLQWYCYQTMVLAPFVFLLLALTGELNPNVVPEEVRLILAKIAPLYFVFTFYLFYRYRNYINFSVAPKGAGRYLALFQLTALPLAGIFIALPFSAALALRALRRQPQIWVKTPRTSEVHSKT